MAIVVRRQAVEITFEEAVVPHLASAGRLARALLGNPHDAEDAVQDASLRALRYFRTFDGRDARAWFLCIVRHTCHSSRVRSGHLANDPFDEERHTAVTPARSQEARLMHRDGLGAVNRALDGMSPRFRELFVLREVEGLSYRQLAAHIGAPVGTVMSGLSRARRAVRGALAPNARVHGARRVRDSRGACVAFQ
jgi:RNA polymerase sigma factor (sigma-70 family)